ncbi:hypothetical protein ACQ4PT_016550 [Festuca glaucescens]
MSVRSKSTEHELTAFWAPLLLVHLGGQDNIIAYAIEDSQLWLRHLQVFGAQVMAAAYVLYESSILCRRTLLRPATILISVVGVLKYGERVWALVRASSCTSSSLSAGSYRDFHNVRVKPSADHTWWEKAATSPSADTTESLLFKAYMMLDVPKEMFEMPTRYVAIDDAYTCDEDEISQLVGVVHTWHGWCVRVVSQLSTVAALLLFHASTANLLHGGCSRVDVVVTYVLLVGAVLLEIMSMLRAVFSTWTYLVLLERGWRRLACVLQFLPRQIRPAMHARYWPGSTHGPSLSQDHIINRVVELVSKSKGVDRESPDHITYARGQGALKSGHMYDELSWTVDMEIGESILVWHIATHFYLSRINGDSIAKATGELSRYMFFLLAVRPSMLPYHGLDLSGLDLSQTSITRLETIGNQTLKRGCHPAAFLISKGDAGVSVVSTICDVWVEMLCYTAYRCNENSQAKLLNNGGDIMTTH